MTQKIVYQGEAGANSHIACANLYPKAQAIACHTFEDCFALVENGDADLAVIPIENSVAGRVADIHSILPTSSLYIIGEYFLPIHHQLLGKKGADLNSIQYVHSHIMALGQCRKFIRQHGLKQMNEADTAGSARMISQMETPLHGAIASTLAAEIYGLDILAENIEDELHNTTRFIILSRHQPKPIQKDEEAITSFVFKVRNVPSALYKAMGGFATNGVNMTKLESYQIDGQFFATQFYVDIEGHPEMRSVALALEELDFFSAEMKILGTYPASSFRLKNKKAL